MAKTNTRKSNQNWQRILILKCRLLKWKAGFDMMCRKLGGTYFAYGHIFCNKTLFFQEETHLLSATATKTAQCSSKTGNMLLFWLILKQFSLFLVHLTVIMKL